MTRFDDKAELYAVVGLLHGRGWTPPTIADAIGYSRSRVHEILVDLGLSNHVRFATLADALQTLEPETAERVLAIREATLSPSREHESVGGA